MPKYRYTVINPENKQLTGTIGAPDEKSAREELNQLGFSIISIHEMNETEAAGEGHLEGKPTTKFEFTAIDKNLKKISGTIQSEDRLSAYKRLIKEYLFEVETLVNADAPEEEKKLQNAKGVYDLQNQLDTEELAQKKEKKENFDFEAFTEQQKILQFQVEFVLQKVKEILDTYSSEIKPETKEKIRRYVDKILRLKNSTNLDYLRNTCEELLIFLQKEEIFLHEEQRKKEHAKLTLEAKTMMASLNRRSTKAPSFTDILRKWREEHILKNDQPTTIEKLLNLLIIFTIGSEEFNPEIKEISEKIKTINSQLKQYFIIYFQANNQDIKLEARDALKRLWQERKRLKKDLSIVKRKLKLEKKKRSESSFLEKLVLEIYSFSGWLLVFYLVYYFAIFFLTQKHIPFIELPKISSFYESVFLKYFITLLFLFYSALSLKITFFKRNGIASLVLVPAAGFGALLVLLNF